MELKNEKKFKEIGYENEELREEIAQCEKQLEKHGYFSVSFTHRANLCNDLYYPWRDVFDKYFSECKRKINYPYGQTVEIKYYV